MPAQHASGEDSPEASGAVALIPRPGSLLHGSLWHPDPSVLSAVEARRILVDIGRARAFLGALEALAVERIRVGFEDEARQAAARQASAEQPAGPQRFDGAVAHALTVSEVAVAECISEAAAARLVESSEALCGAQLAVLEGLEGGELSEAHARVITEETATLPEACAEEFGIKALAKLETRTGRRRTPGEFRRAVRDLRERLHPDSIRARKARAAADRRVFVRPEPDGMCTLSAFLPAEVGLAAFGRLDSLARAQRGADPEDGRTLPQLRADALACLVLDGDAGWIAAASEAEGALAEPAPAADGGAHGAPHGGSGLPGVNPVVGDPVPSAEIVVVISAATLLGASEEPATLEGYGAIDAETARELAVAAPTWQRLFTGAEGVALALGRSAYRPPKGLRRFIEYRDGTCQFPACSRPARRGEIDHMVEWQDGGATNAENLQALCGKHHALKSLRLWSAQRLSPEPGGGAGDIVWVSPLGGRAVAGPSERGSDEPRESGPDGRKPGGRKPGERSLRGQSWGDGDQRERSPAEPSPGGRSLPVRDRAELSPGEPSPGERGPAGRAPADCGGGGHPPTNRDDSQPPPF